MSVDHLVGLDGDKHLSKDYVIEYKKSGIIRCGDGQTSGRVTVD